MYRWTGKIVSEKKKNDHAMRIKSVGLNNKKEIRNESDDYLQQRAALDNGHRFVDLLFRFIMK